MIDKTNFIRLLDVFLIGPLMIYAAKRAKMPQTYKTVLYASGVGTILYNGFNLMLSPMQNAINKNDFPITR